LPTSLIIPFRNKYGIMTRVRTDTLDVPAKKQYGHENSGGYYDKYSRTVKKAKIEIVMTRTEDFFEHMERFEKMRADSVKHEAQEAQKLHGDKQEANGEFGSADKTSATSSANKPDVKAEATH
jgi:hypothetical protein